MIVANVALGLLIYEHLPIFWVFYYVKEPKFPIDYKLLLSYFDNTKIFSILTYFWLFRNWKCFYLLLKRYNSLELFHLVILVDILRSLVQFDFVVVLNYFGIYKQSIDFGQNVLI